MLMFLYSDCEWSESSFLTIRTSGYIVWQKSGHVARILDIVFFAYIVDGVTTKRFLTNKILHESKCVAELLSNS